MNEAETRAELHRSRAESRRLGRRRGQSGRREQSAPGRIKGGGERAKADIADYVLSYRNRKLAVIEAKAWDKPTPKASGRPRTTPPSCRRGSPTPPTAGHLRHRHGDRRGRRCRPLPDARTSCGPRRFAEAERLARPVRRRALRDQGGTWQCATTRTSPSSACSRLSPPGKRPHPADAGHRHRQDLDRLPDRLEAVPEPLEPVARARPPAAHPVPGRPQHPRRPGLQRLLGLPRGRAGAHQARRHPQEGQGAEERQRVLHDLPDLHERRADGRRAAPTSASTRPTSSTSSSSTNAIAAAPTTRAPGAASSSTSRPPCSSA